MKLSRRLHFLAMALVPALSQAVPTKLPVTWEQRAPGGFDAPATLFRGTLYALGSDGGGSDGILWASTDTGRTWTPQPGNGRKLTGIKSFWIDGKEVLFLAGSNGTSASQLIRRDKDGEAVVLDSIESFFWNYPIVQAGDILLLRTRKALMRSADAGVTWVPVDPPFLSISPYRELEPAIFSGTGKRLFSMVSQQRALYSSLDSGKSWKRISQDFSVPVVYDGGVTDASGETIVLPYYYGAPIRLRFQGDAWTQDTLRKGWPLDSLGLGSRSRSVAFYRDTIWATAGKNLLYWVPSESSWRSAGIDLPNFGDQVLLDTLAGDLWLFGAEWVVRRGAGGKITVVTAPDSKIATPRTALAWHEGALFLCGWSGCAISKDSGKTWGAANRGLEGTYVVELKSTSQGLTAVTGTFGLRLWNGVYWQDIGMSGVDRDSVTGQYSLIASLTSVGDTLAFSWGWKKGIWMRKGKQAGWSLIEHGKGDRIAWAEGAYWASRSFDTLETSRSGSVWATLKAPFGGTVHEANGQLLITQSYGNQIARRQGDAFRLDTLAGSFGSYGSFVSSHPSGAMALTSEGVFVLTNSGTYELPFDHASTSFWISGMLLVGNRLFVTHSSGMLSTTLPSDTNSQSKIQ